MYFLFSKYRIDPLGSVYFLLCHRWGRHLGIILFFRNYYVLSHPLLTFTKQPANWSGNISDFDSGGGWSQSDYPYSGSTWVSTVAPSSSLGSYPELCHEKFLSCSSLDYWHLVIRQYEAWGTASVMKWALKLPTATFNLMMCWDSNCEDCAKFILWT